MRRTHRHTSRRSAFTLLEALFLVAIVSIVAVAAGVGLQAGVQGPHAADDALAIDSVIASKVETLKVTAATNFANLANQAGSSSVTINNTSYTQTISIAAQPKPDGSGGTATDYSKITVQIGSRSMTTYVSQP